MLNVPSYQTQNSSVAQIREVEDHVQSLIEIYEKKLDSLDQLKKSILQKAFTGQLTAKDAA